MKKGNEKEELKALKSELTKLKKENRTLLKKVENINTDRKELRKELKKNDDPKTTLTKKQQQLLSNLLNGTNTQSSSSD